MVSQEATSNYSAFDYIESLNSDYYISLLDSIKKGKSTDYFSLRVAYTKTDEYSPYDTEINDSLDKVISFIDSQKYNEALDILNNIQHRTYVNIPSHLYKGYIYGHMGDSLKYEFHSKVYSGLLNSIYESGNGSTPETAYIVINTKEEYSYLNWFNLQLIEQELFQEDGFKFDLMKVSDIDSGEEYSIYFNISLALNKLDEMISEP